MKAAALTMQGDAYVASLHGTTQSEVETWTPEECDQALAGLKVVASEVVGMSARIRAVRVMINDRNRDCYAEADHEGMCTDCGQTIARPAAFAHKRGCLSVQPLAFVRRRFVRIGRLYRSALNEGAR